ncbi:unnamed protein product [Symbiodinium natans]|uniref:Uncharacterized protein n=1 Tax=Symbiodinium natans TaxID=878477 RepID=A0A812VE94_9DINO|nr:unnamed protein product [Symbiodinium natans]
MQRRLLAIVLLAAAQEQTCENLLTCQPYGNPNEEGAFMQVRVADESQMAAAMASSEEDLKPEEGAALAGLGNEELAKEVQRMAGADSSCLTDYPGLTDLAEALRSSLGEGSNSSLAKALRSLEEILRSHQRDVELVQGLGQKEFLACNAKLRERTRLEVQRLFALSRQPRSECGSRPCPSEVRESFCAGTSIACGTTDCSRAGGEPCENWTIGSTSGDPASSTERTQGCDARTQLVQGLCDHFASVRSSCDRLSACWAAAELHVRETVEAVQLRVSRRKAAYTATQRMICHINIISEVATLAAPSAEPLTASIKDCAELRVDTSILNITFPQDRTEKASCDQTSCFLSAASLFTMSCDVGVCRAVAASRARDQLLEIQSSEVSEAAQSEREGRCWFSTSSSEPVLRDCPKDCFEMPQAETTQAPSYSYGQSYYAGRNAGWNAGWRWRWRRRRHWQPYRPYR